MTNPLKNIIEFDFHRAAMPFVFAGATLMSGCATTTNVSLNMDSCHSVKSTQTTLGAALRIASNKPQGQSQACSVSRKISDLAFKDQDGRYNLTALAAIVAVYKDPKLNPELKDMIKVRLAQEHGITPEQIPQLAQQQWEKDHPHNVQGFTCVTTDVRRCTTSKADKALPANIPAPAAN